MPLSSSDTHTSKLELYFQGAAAGILAKVLSFVSAFGVLWILNKILTKEQFGSYTFSMTVIMLLILICTLGQDRAIFYRLAGKKADMKRINGGEFVFETIRRVFLINIIVVVAIILISILAAPGTDDIFYWLKFLCMLIPLSVVNQILSAWFQSQQRFAVSIIVPKFEDVLRAFFLLMVLFFCPNRTGIVFAILLANLGTILLWSLFVPFKRMSEYKKLSTKDILYGFKLMATKLVHMGLERVDVILVGILATKLAVAEYSVGAKLAIIAYIGNDLLAPVFTPRMRHHLGQNNKSSLFREYQQIRFLSLFFTLVVAALFTFFGFSLLNIFGDYGASKRILLILVAGGIVKMGFGPTGRYLNMAGYASISLLLTILLLISNFGLNLILIPKFLGVGAALSVFFCFIAINTCMAIYIWQKDKFPTVDFFTGFVMVTSCIGLFLSAFEIVPSFWIGSGLVLLTVVQAILQRDLWLPIIKN